MTGSLWRRSATLATGSAIAQSITLLATPLITRNYQPDVMGTFALFMAIVAPMSIVAAGRYEAAIALPESEEVANNVAVLSLMLTALSSVLVLAVVISIGTGRLAISLGQLNAWALLMPPIVLLIGALQVLSALAIRRAAMTVVAKGRVVGALATSAYQVSAGFQGAHVGGLVLGAVIGQCASLVQVAVPLVGQRKLGLKRPQWRELITLAREYRKFPLFNGPHVLMDHVQAAIVLFLILRYFGPYAVGIYALTLRVMRAPLALVGSAMGQVFYQDAARIRSDGEAVRALSIALLRRMAGLVAVPMLLIAAAGPSLAAVILGDDWKSTGNLARIMVPYFGLHFLAAPLSQLPMLYGRQAVALRFALVGNLIYIGGIFVGAAVNSLEVGLTVTSIAMAAYFGLFIRWALRLAPQEANRR